MGWKITGNFPTLKKFVVIMEPHTSWVDFPVAIMANYVTGLHANYVGKASLFKPPFGFIFRKLGGAPVDRSKNSNVVQQIVAIFNSKDRFILGMSPKGTRKKTDEWKTGFYYIAKGAKVPVVMGTLDFGNKEIRISEPYHITDNKEKDFAHFRSFYKGVIGRHPELT